MYKVIIILSVLFVLINCKLTKNSKNDCDRVKYHIENSNVIIDEIYLQPIQLRFLDTLHLFVFKNIEKKHYNNYDSIILKRLNENSINIFQLYAYIKIKDLHYNLSSIPFTTVVLNNNIVELKINNLRNYEAEIRKNTIYKDSLFKEDVTEYNNFNLIFRWDNNLNKFTTVKLDKIRTYYLPHALEQ